MKPITVAILLMASVPANYFAFDFASKNIDSIPAHYLPNLPDLSKLTNGNVQYCGNQKAKSDESNEEIAMREQVSRSKQNLSKSAESFISITRRKVEKEWGSLINTHGITKNSYRNCQTTIEIILSPNGDYNSINIVERSGSDKFDDIAFLSPLHTNFNAEFNNLPDSTKREVTQFDLRLSVGNVR